MPAVEALYGTGGAHDGPGPTSPPRRGGRGRGRGRGRGGGDAYSGADRNHEQANSRGRGRGRGRGRQERAADKGKAPAAQSPEAQPAPLVNPEATEVEAEADADEREVCFICASPVQHTAVAPCNHRTCHICSLRLRALYKTKTCAHCRTESDHVILTDDTTKNYEEFDLGQFYRSDDNMGIHFEKAEIFEDTRLLLQYNCPNGECDVACLGWPDLHRHVKTAHGQVMCDLCTRNKKVFTHEHELFTTAELKKHRMFGDDNPGAIDQSGFRGHPECGFCRQRFYGDDELFAHCRDKHERCHICDRRSGGARQQYFQNYDTLEVHFRKDHFLCPDRECLEKKFVVFDSEMDLKAHQLEVHPNGLSKDALRDARRVDISGFQIRESQQYEADGRRDGRGRGREGGRGRGRGRDPNSEPLPASSAQPMSRAELAYQRQRELQNNVSASGRTFGGQLTSAPTPSEAFAARAPAAATEPPTVTATRPATTNANQLANGVDRLSLNAQSSAAPQTPQDQARALRHAAVTERASNMLRNDEAKLQEFRGQVSAYRNSKVTATQLIEGFFALFDTSSVELGKLIKELADIFEIQPKREGLLKAWSDWKAINEDYPSLPGSATEQSLSGALAAHGGSRVLKLKSSTAQSSRSSVSKQASWNSASSGLFPPLPAASSSSSGIGAKPGQTPWATSSTSTASRVSPLPSRAATPAAAKKGPSASADAFPALPAAPKPLSTIFSPGYTGAGLRRDHSGRNTAANAWTGAGTGASNAANAEGAGMEDAGGAGKKKGNKNKKQTLFHFG